MDNLSVLIRCRNEERWIGHSIQSVIDTFENPEIVVVDNGSTDNSKDVVQMFKEHLGLKIEVTNRGIDIPKTRYQFMVQKARGMERDILWEIKDIDTDVSWKDHVKEEHVNN